MNGEALIELSIEKTDGCFLVSCAKFPFLHLQLEEVSDSVIENRVFPLLKNMVEHKVGATVALRFVREFDSNEEVDDDVFVPHHIIAERLATQSV